MRVIHGTSAVSIQSTRYLCDEMKKKGHRCDIVIYFEHPFFSDFADYNLKFRRKNYLHYPLYLYKAIFFMIFSVKEYDLFHFHFGRSFLPLNIDLMILKFHYVL